MDSLTLYSFEAFEKDQKDESVNDFADLDPNSELSIDFEHLIDTPPTENGVLFPELFSSAEASLGLSVEHVAESDIVINLDSETCTTVSEGTVSMPEFPTIGTPKDEAGCPLFSVKSEPESAHCVEAIEPVQLVTSKVLTQVTPSETVEVKRIAGRPRSSPKAAAPSRKSRRRQFDKDSEEYRERRERNNIAVRKSRDKAKLKQGETNARLQILTRQNEALQSKCDQLTKELNVLKGLFVTVGASMPKEYKEYLQKNQGLQV